MGIPHSFAETTATMLWRASWYATVLIPIAWLACRLFLHRMPRQVHCWIWRLVYLKIAVAAIWVKPISLPVLPSIDPVATSQLESVASVLTHPRNKPSEVDVTGSAGIDAWRYTFVCVWILGVAWHGVRLLKEGLFALRVRRRARPCHTEGLVHGYRQSAANIGISHPPRLLVTGHLNVPALVGICRPAVVIPERLPQQISLEELKLVFSHELAHFKRFDSLWNLIARLVDSALFFHPLIWVASVRWKSSQEAACDEMALQKSGVQTSGYAQMLIKVTNLSPPTHSSHFATIGVVGSFRSLQERIKVMRTSTNWSRRAYAAAFAASISIALGGIVPWQLVAQEAAPADINDPPAVEKDESREPRFLPVVEDTERRTPQVDFLRANGIGGIELNDNDEVIGVAPVIRNADAVLAVLASDKTVQRLHIAQTNLSSEGLSALASLENLKELHLSRMPAAAFNDESLKSLAGLKQLEKLSFQQMAIRGHGMRHLSGLAKLRKLAILHCGFTDEGLEHVRRLEGLQSLILSATENRSLYELRGMKSLKFLSIQMTPLDDEGMAALGTLENLTNLNINHTQVQGDGLKHLVGLDKLCLVVVEGRQFRKGGHHLRKLEPLRALFVVHSDLADADAALFDGFGQLMILGLKGTKMTNKGVNNIRALLPDVQVSNRRESSS